MSEPYGYVIAAAADTYVGFSYWDPAQERTWTRLASDLQRARVFNYRDHAEHAIGDLVEEGHVLPVYLRIEKIGESKERTSDE